MIPRHHTQPHGLSFCFVFQSKTNWYFVKPGSSAGDPSASRRRASSLARCCVGLQSSPGPWGGKAGGEPHWGWDGVWNTPMEKHPWGAACDPHLCRGWLLWWGDEAFRAAVIKRGENPTAQAQRGTLVLSDGRELGGAELVPLVTQSGLEKTGNDLVGEVQGGQESRKSWEKVATTTSFPKLQHSLGLRFYRKILQHNELPPISRGALTVCVHSLSPQQLQSSII